MNKELLVNKSEDIKENNFLSEALRSKIFKIENIIKDNKDPEYNTFINDTKNCPLTHYF